MRKLFLFTLLVLPALLLAQETEQKHTINFSGYIGYEMFFDTYNSVTARDGEVYLYPLQENLDDNGEDLNKNFKAQMLAIQSRVRLTSAGLNAFGANLKGVIEGDFLGIPQGSDRLFRLRHAFVQLDWEKSHLLLGQTWHPMFVTGCFPGVFSFAAGAPFNPLNRSPQIRYTFSPTKNLDIMGAMLIHGNFKSSGPANALQNSGIPDLQFQLTYKNDMIFTGITAGYKVLKPRTMTTIDSVKTDETIGSFNVQMFAKITTKPITVKLQGVYGQNLTNFVMIGGYGASENPASVDDYSYINLNTMSVWGEVATNFKKFNAGLFLAYSSNLGAKDNYYSLGYERGKTIDNIYRISPRVQYTSGKLTFILEHMMTGAAYGTAIDLNGKPTGTSSPTVNHRVVFGAKYSF